MDKINQIVEMAMKQTREWMNENTLQTILEDLEINDRRTAEVTIGNLPIICNDELSDEIIDQATEQYMKEIEKLYNALKILAPKKDWSYRIDREEIINRMVKYQANGWADLDNSSWADILRDGLKGWKEYSDSELIEEWEEFEDEIIESEFIDFCDEYDLDQGSVLESICVEYKIHAGTIVEALNLIGKKFNTTEEFENWLSEDK